MPYGLRTKVASWANNTPMDGYDASLMNAAKTVWSTTLTEVEAVICPACDGYGHRQKNCPTYNMLTHAHNGNHSARRLIRWALQERARERAIPARPTHGYATLCGKRSRG